MGEERPINRRRVVAFAAGLAVLAGLYLASRYSFLLFHALAEGFSVVVAASVFLVAWNSRRFLKNNYLLFIGIAYLFVAALDLVHTMAYKGMPFFPGYDSNLPTQLWLAARYTGAASLLLAPLFVDRPLNVSKALAAYAAVTVALLWAVFSGVFPDCFVEGAGLTPFKKTSEYIISGMLLGSAYLLHRRREAFDRGVLRLLYASIFVAVGAELAFTFYVSVYGLSNLVGHYLKIVSFFLLYRALVETGLREPYKLLFMDLKQSEEALQDAFSRVRASEAEVSALFKASRAVLDLRDFKASARAIFDYCKGLVGARAGYVALLSRDGVENEVLFLDPGGIPCSVDPALPMPIRGLRGEAYQTGKVVYENDFSRSEWAKFMPEGHAELQNVMFAPLVVEGKAVGLMGLANKDGGFTPNDAKVAAAFGEIAAVALQNSMLLDFLEESEERFRSVAQTAGDAIVTSDRGGDIIFWNRAAEKVFGWSAKEAVGKPIAMIIPEAMRGAHEGALAGAVEAGRLKNAGWPVEFTGLRKDGSEFPVELSLSDWKTKGGAFFSAIIRDVTERKRAEAHARHLSSFPKLNPSPVIEVDSSGKAAFLNPATETFLAEKGLGREDAAVFFPEDLGGILSGYDRGSELSLHREVAVKDRVFSELIHLSSQFEEGNIARIYAHDITERKRAEEKLQKENRAVALINSVLRVFVEEAGDDMFDKALKAVLEGTRSRHGVFGYIDEKGVLVCPSMTKLLDQCEIEGKCIHYPPEKWKGLWARALREKQAFYINTRPWVPSGHVAIENNLAAPILFHGNVIGLFNLANKEAGGYTEEDKELLEAVSGGVAPLLYAWMQKEMREDERKQAEEKISGLLSQLKGIFDNLPIGIAYLDADMKVRSVNSFFCNLAGVPEEELIGRHCYDTVGEYADDPARQGLERMCSFCKKPEAFERKMPTVMERPLGSSFVRVTTVPQVDGDGNIGHFLEMVEDITKQKEIDEVLQAYREHLEEIVAERTAELVTANEELEREMAERVKAEAQLFQSQKMEAVGRLAGGVAHDFNNRLFAIRNYAFIIKTMGGGAAETAEKVIASCDKAARLVEDLLHFSRRKEINPVPVDLNKVIAESKNLVEVAVGKDVALEWRLSDTALTVMADPVRTEHVLLNLVTNARDAMGGGGKIEIKTEKAEALPPHVAEGGGRGQYAAISVSDTGPGMDEKTRERIFEPFFTTKEAGKGTGLGLAIAYSTVTQHGGFIEVQSAPGEGTAFRIYLPLLQAGGES